jgi:phage major head subunit gpT-like protein
MAAITSNFADLLFPGFREIAFQKFNYYENEYDKICTVVNSNKAYEKTSSVCDIGYFPEKAEGSAITYEELVQGYDKQINNKTFAKGISISRELYEDDQYGIMNRMAAAVGTAARQTMELAAANLLNNGSVTTYNTGGDGLALFSQVHTNPAGKGGTWSNLAATPADLSIATLKLAINLIEATTSESGMPLMLKAKKLVVAPLFEFEAKQIVQSAYLPGGATNDINAVKDRGLEVVVNHFLTDSDQWCLISDQSPLIFQMRRPFSVDKDSDTNTQNALFLGSYRIGLGFNDARGIVCNVGA